MMQLQDRRLLKPFQITAALYLLALAGCTITSTPPRSGPAPLESAYPPPSPELASLSTAYPPQPIDFISEQGQFNITFPCCDLARSALAEFTTTKSIYGNQFECHVVVLPEDGASWTVQYCDLPPDLLTSISTEGLINWASNDALSDARARPAVATEQPTTGEFEATLPGRSTTAQANMRGLLADGTLKARIYLAENRIYEVSARVYNANWGNRLAMIDPFLDSFFLHSSLTIPFEATSTPA